jgi:hypothetical protein
VPYVMVVMTGALCVERSELVGVAMRAVRSSGRGRGRSTGRRPTPARIDCSVDEDADVVLGVEATDERPPRFRRSFSDFTSLITLINLYSCHGPTYIFRCFLSCLPISCNPSEKKTTKHKQQQIDEANNERVDARPPDSEHHAVHFFAASNGTIGTSQTVCRTVRFSPSAALARRLPRQRYTVQAGTQ